MLDVSIVTDKLRDLLLSALASSPLFGGAGPGFSVAVTGQHPQTLSTGADCDLNLYLFYLTEDKHVRNQFWRQEFVTGQPPGQARQPVAFEPLCLDLFFLLSAQSQTSYVHEQQVMSIAMRAMHENATVTLPTPEPITGKPTSQITLTMEKPSWDELSRLWQALNAPLRMTAQYRASVALMTPETGAVAAKKPTTVSLTGAANDAFGGRIVPYLVGTSRRVTFEAPAGRRLYDQTPASLVPAPAGVAGQDVVLRGEMIADADPIFLVTHHADGTETELDITAWKVALTVPYPAPPGRGVSPRLRAPATPGVCPEPGRYTLRVGWPGPVPGRSNEVPVSIAPWIDPTGGPRIMPVAGVFTCTVANVPAAEVELRLGAVRLNRSAAGPPAAGEWQLAGATLRFRAPAGLPVGEYAVRLRAADIEADPALWAVIP